MNRIYQGRANKLELLDDQKIPEITAEYSRSKLSEFDNPLWQHHQIFQDAANYYLVALGAMARGATGGSSDPSERLAADLIGRLELAWDEFPRSIPGETKPRSLRDSLKNWLGLDDDSSLDDAFDKILSGNESTDEVRRLALQLILNKCGGDSAIQQGGRSYLPKLVVSEYSGSWDFDTTAMAADKGKAKLSESLHSELEENVLTDLAREMEITWAGIKRVPDQLLEGDALAERLETAIEHQCKRFSKSSTTAENEILERHPDICDKLNQFRSSIKSVSKTVALPINKGGNISWDLVHAAYLFKVFPTKETAAILALSVKRPALRKKSEALPSIDYSRFGDDPIKLARNKNRYVFRAFTALPAWNPDAPGKPVWKEFDIAAFKEALKGLNQFNQKTMEREDDKIWHDGKLAILLGGNPSGGWTPKKAESGEAEANPLPLDPDLFSLCRQLEAQLTQQLADTVLGDETRITYGEGAELHYRPGEWKISTAALRGYRDIAPLWNQALVRQDGELEQDDLEKIVKDYQKGEKNRKVVGSIPLLLELCDPMYWDLWRKDRDPCIKQDEPEYNRFLFKMVDFHTTRRDYDRACEAINLTPAEPRYSRRLYMFSDIKGAEKMVIENEQSIRTTLAFFEGTTCRKRKVRITFTAPRLKRDELTGGETSRWLQPMTSALGINPPASDESFDSACSLMPGLDREGHCRLLLNFPKTIDESWLKDEIGKSSIWNGQCNGVKDKNIHLHWPQNDPKTKQAQENPWWKNPEVIENGFTTLSVDLGQRIAGAWALLRVTCFKPKTKRPVRFVGNDGELDWFAEVLHTGMFRLPGEDQKVRDKTGEMNPEYWGKKGRKSQSHEHDASLELAKHLGADSPPNWVGTNRNSKSLPQQNDSLIALANRRLSRLATYHRWSCFSENLKRYEEDQDRKAQFTKKLLKELGHWEDEEVGEWKKLLEHGDVESFSQQAGEKFTQYRTRLLPLLLELANRTVPLRRKKWAWRLQGNKGYGELFWEENSNTEGQKIRGQRGLSMERLEQLEGLRKLFLRYNRSLDKEAGVLSNVGYGFSHDSGEPAQLLLDKIDRMKEQRINQTAHLILAQALGVRLRRHRHDKETRQRRDIHGEYETIPERNPVDLIVIENLDRYLTSQGRAPSENRRLMKWAHRAIRDKLKMLAEEPFGIPLLEAPAAYSSRFCARTSQPGIRCEERSGLDDYLRERLRKRAATPPPKPRKDNTEIYKTLLSQFAELEEENQLRKIQKKAPRSLLLPKPGGPLFLSAIDSPLTQADTNAAINIGLRAIGAPESLHLFHKVRTTKKGNSLKPVMKNAREKVAYERDSTIVPQSEFSKKATSATNPNFFYLSESALGKYSLDRATVSIKGDSINLISGIALHTTTEDLVLQRIVEINRERIRRWNSILLT